MSLTALVCNVYLEDVLQSIDDGGTNGYSAFFSQCLVSTYCSESGVEYNGGMLINESIC